MELSNFETLVMTFVVIIGCFVIATHFSNQPLFLDPAMKKKDDMAPMPKMYQSHQQSIQDLIASMTWKEELRVLCEKTSLREGDFDPKAVRLLDEYHSSGKLELAMDAIEQSVNGQPRNNVQNMRRYIYTLLRRVDRDIYGTYKLKSRQEKEDDKAKLVGTSQLDTISMLLKSDLGRESMERRSPRTPPQRSEPRAEPTSRTKSCSEVSERKDHVFNTEATEFKPGVNAHGYVEFVPGAISHGVGGKSPCPSPSPTAAAVA